MTRLTALDTRENYFFKSGREKRTLYFYVFPDSLADRLHYLFYHPRQATLTLLKHRYERVATIGEICSEPIIKGKQPIYADEGIMVIKTVDMKNGWIEYDSCLKVSEEFFSAHPTAHIRKGDVLVAATGYVSMGKVDVYDRDEPAMIDCQLLALRVREGWNPYFVAYYLRSHFGQLQFDKWFSGSSGQIHLYERDIESFVIPIVLPERQDEIVATIQSIINQANDSMARAKAIRAAVTLVLPKKLGIEPPAVIANYFFKTGGEKQTLWFTVFPGEVTDRLHHLFFHPRHQALNTMRERYCIVRLAEICREPITRGEQPEYDELGDVTVLKTVDLKNSYIDYDNALKVSQEFFDAHPTAHVQKGDVLIASTGYVSMGKVDVYDRDEPAMVDGHISIVRVNDDYDPYFVAYFLRSHLGQLQFEKWFTGSSGQIELQPTDLGEFIVPASGDGGVPSKEQKRIASIITEPLNEARELARQAEMKWREAKERFEKMILGES